MFTKRKGKDRAPAVDPNTHKSSAKPDAARVARLRAIVKKHGLRPTAERMGLHPETLLRFLAEVPMRDGSIVLVDERFVLVEGW